MAVIRLAHAAPVISYSSPFMPTASFFLSAVRPWRLLSTTLLAAATAAFAQLNTPSAADGFDPSVDGNVYALALQPDGKLIVAGQFAQLQPGGVVVFRDNLARLNTDGTVDFSFDPKPNGPVRALLLQADGKILVGGDFTTVQPNGAAAAATRNRLVRLNADGTLDAAFNPNIGGGFTPQVNALALQADGRIVVGGGFTTVGTSARNRLARLNADGSLDAAYNPNANNLVFALALHADGKMVVGGGFTTMGTTGRNRLARLNPDGTVDSEFNPNLDNRVTALAVQRDGKIVLGGDFAALSPTGTALARSRLARLNANGSLDSAFNANASASVLALAIQPDGRILAGGSFTAVWSGATTAGQSNFARFNVDGSVDTTISSSANQTVAAFALQPDGKFIIGGNFTGIRTIGLTNTAVRNRLARLNPDGSLDTTLDVDSSGRPLASAVQRDGKVVIGGSFTSLGGVTHNRLARLNADGSVDATFNPNFNGRVLAIVIEPATQKIIVGGSFNTVGGETRNYLARLNPSGTIDSEFNPNLNDQVGALALQADGKILLGGSFTTFQAIGATAVKTRTNAARLNPDGSLDAAFHPNTNGNVVAIAVQPDGKILLAGAFNTVTPEADLTVTTTTAPTVTSDKAGSSSKTAGNITTTTSISLADNVTTTVVNSSSPAMARNNLARFNADGTLDTAFDPSINAQVSALLVQADGKILIGGLFTQLRAHNATTTDARNWLARFNADGTLDTAYNPNPDNAVLALALQADGRVLVGGQFTTFTPNAATTYTVRKYTARLNTDGTVEPSFNLDLNEINGNRVDSLLVQPDGKALVGGGFISLQPVGSAARVRRNHYARINADGTLDNVFQPGAGGSAGAQINALALQSDFRLLVAGAFTNLAGTTTTNIARLNAEGTPDASFSTSLSADGPINAILLRAEGARVIPQGGGLGWLNSNGTLRAAFNPPASSRITGSVNAVAVQPDGRVIVGGTFSTATGTPGGNLVRFSAAGVIEPNFGPNPNGPVTAIVVQPDGRILVAGSFTTVGGLPRNNLTRLNADGTVDFTFDPDTNGRVNAVVLQPDGRIVIGGAFTTLNPNVLTTTTTTTTTTTPNVANSTNTVTNTGGGTTTTTINTVSGTTTTTVVTISSVATARSYLARLNSSGTLDTTYIPNANGVVSALLRQTDGKLVVGGTFTAFQPNGATATTTRNNIARLNDDGTVDTAYNPNASSSVLAMAFAADGKVLLGGGFTTFAPNGSATPTVRYYVARLNPDGTLDSNFNPFANNLVTAIAVQPDSRVLLGGAFTTLQPNGAAAATARNHLARVNGDGSLDTAFDPNANGAVNALAAFADGSVIAGGQFTALEPNSTMLLGGAFNNLGGVASRNLALVSDDGAISTSFQPNPNGAVNALLLQPDGKTVVAGAFTNIAGATRNALARFNADGTLDAAFVPAGIGAVKALALQPDGKIIVAGSPAGVSTTGALLARFNADGTRDAAFSPAIFLPPIGLALQADGRILVTTNQPALLRFNADGSADSSFLNPAFNGPIAAVAVQADGRIVVGGTFTTVAGTAISRLARLNANGTADPTFNPAPDGAVSALALQSDGRVVAGGSFTRVGGLVRNGLVRLTATAPAAQTLAATRTSVVLARAGTAPEIAGVILELSSDSFTWTRLGQGTRVSGNSNWQLTGLSLPASGLFYVRARSLVPSSSGTSTSVIEAVRELNFTAVPGVGPAGATATPQIVGGLTVDSLTGLIAAESGNLGTGTGTVAGSTGTATGLTTNTTTPVDNSARLVNLSARARVTTANPLITGFAITGTTPRTLLLRGVGPSLGAFGVTGVLSTPRLQLYDQSGRLLLENNSWTANGGLAAVSEAISRTGAFPFSANSATDTAIVVVLAPGTYSMQVVDAAGSTSTGAGQTGGVALAEIYDADSSTTSRLVNISTRGNVNVGDGAFISGFVITGSAAKQLLVRGIGPALSQFSVPGVLADPVVSIYNGAGSLVATNDNWSFTNVAGLGNAASAAIIANAAAIGTVFNAVGAFALEVGSNDASLTLPVSPGAYTVQVSGVGNTTGAALIEIYELP
ncbi:MAG: hypothetical protein EXS32_14645 [Opitutus sp.]|nr:hypothetical protein [Opitutus sp.]